MSLYRLIYVSRVARQVRIGDAEQIAREAEEANRTRGLTGLLVYSPVLFLQVLEGEKSEVLTLLSRIRSDKRHLDLRVLDEREVAAREFGAWAMAARQLDRTQVGDLASVTLEQALDVLRSAR